MVSKKKIKELDFETIEEYFQYIIESTNNGQHKQSKELFKELSYDQKREFRDWIETGEFVKMSGPETSSYLRFLKE